MPRDERNLAYKAAKLFIEKYNISQGVNINIKKISQFLQFSRGSTDAAAVLKIMNRLFNINAEDEN